MRNFYAFTLFVIAGALAIWAFAYFSVEKPTKEAQQITYHNISVAAYDGSTNAQMQADFIIVSNGQNYAGRTNPSGFVVQRVPTNFSVEIFTFSPGYYTAYTKPAFAYAQPTALRIESLLYPIGNLSIRHSGQFRQDEDLELSFISKGRVNPLMLCLRWSPNVVSVAIPDSDINNATLVEPPKRLQNKVDKCYAVNKVFRENEPVFIPLTYRAYGQLSASDSIKVIVLYGDITPSSSGQVVYETPDGKPLVKPDAEYVIQ